MSDPYAGQGWPPGQPWGGQQPGWGVPPAAPDPPPWQQAPPQPPAWQQQPAWQQPARSWGSLGTPGGGGGTSRKGLWWTLGAAGLALVVAAGVVVFLLLRGVGEPGAVAVDADDDGRVVVSWEAAPRAESYEVYRDADLLGTTTETSWPDPEAPGATEVRYSVVAVGEDGDRSESVAADPFVTPLDAPAAVTLTVEGPDVVVSWRAVDGAERYEVLRDGEVVAADVAETTFTDVVPENGDHVYGVVALDDDGAGRSTVTEQEVFAPGPWEEAWAIGQAFPDLVGPKPGAAAWMGATCEINTVDTLEAFVFCEYPNGLYVEVLQFPDVAAQDARVEEIRDIAEPGNRTWTGPSGEEEGGLFRSPAASATPWLFLTFWDGELDLFAVYADWEGGHTAQELDEVWFAYAPLLPE
ncbi:fibronectin type III domain-containing protein [Geodermatophilus sp. SYSU D00691]